MKIPTAHSSRINNIAHFIWFGEQLPLAYVLGIKSALINGGFEQVVLHLEQNLSDNSDIEQYIQAHPNFQIRLISDDHFANVDTQIPEMYHQLSNRRAKSNVLRLIVLARWGGVYLDTDVIVLKDFSPFRDTSFFYGKESNRYPHFTEHRSKIYLKSFNILHGIVRYLLARAPHGLSLYRWYEKKFFYQLPNNCVIGAIQKHPFLEKLFNNMLALDAETRPQKWQLGVRLFQRTIAHASRVEQDSLTAHPYPVFNPLGPVISRLWFKRGSAQYQQDLHYPETALIHWYSTSVNNQDPNCVTNITSEAIDQNRDNKAIYCFLKEIKDQKL